MINLKIKRLFDNAILPTKAYLDDAAFDIYSPEDVIIKPHSSTIIDTGIATEIPKGYYASVYVRSSIGIKRNLQLCNGTGIIDAGYRNTWKIALYNYGDIPQSIDKGERFAQFILLPVLEVSTDEVEDLSFSDRGQKGIGSSGK